MSNFQRFSEEFEHKGSWSVDKAREVYRDVKEDLERASCWPFSFFLFPFLWIKMTRQKTERCKTKNFLGMSFSKGSFLTCPHLKSSYILVYQRRLRT